LLGPKDTAPKPKTPVNDIFSSTKVKTLRSSAIKITVRVTGTGLIPNLKGGRARQPSEKKTKEVLRSMKTNEGEGVEGNSMRRSGVAALLSIMK
jgi:hypothetical protein